MVLVTVAARNEKTAENEIEKTKMTGNLTTVKIHEYSDFFCRDYCGEQIS